MDDISENTYLISVVIPTYNRAYMTERAVHSVFSQNFEALKGKDIGIELEIIVVDDGSTEDYSSLEKLLVEHKKTDASTPCSYKSCKYLRIPKSGVSKARNAGIVNAQGSWIAFLDSDDVWNRDKLQEQIIYIHEHPECEFIQTKEKWFRNGTQIIIPDHLKLASGNAFQRSLALCCISPSTVMIKADILKETGLFDERFVVCEDYDLWLRLTARHEIHLLEKELVDKYSSPHIQLSRTQIAMDRFRVFALLKVLTDDYFEEEHKNEVPLVLLKKIDILRSGARKRKKYTDEYRYDELYSKIAMMMKNGWHSSFSKEIETIMSEATFLLEDRRYEEESEQYAS